MDVTPRYSVCLPGLTKPTEVFATNDREAAFAHARNLDTAVVYDWTTGEPITE